MSRQIRKILTLLLVLAMAISISPAQALEIETASNSGAGEGVTAASADVPEDGTDSVAYVNPIYQDVIEESDLNQPLDDGIAAVNVDEYCSTIEEAGSMMREHLKKREETITVGYQAASYDSTLAKSISNQAMVHTGVPTEGDYLKWQYAGWRASISYQTISNVCYMSFTYTVTYYTTSAQESEMDTAVSDLLQQLSLQGKSDYQKVCGIYDYICAHVTYDYTNLNDDDYKLKYTAYAALINGTSVCQGYAVLFYRMALELNVDARLISGLGNGGAHAWNIVKLDGSYYNLDSTWDAGRFSYSYFLKSDSNFGSHTRDTEYLTEEFAASYPMGDEDYTPRPETENPFEDVTSSAYYYDSVLWAYTNGITTGRTVDGKVYFMPTDSCTRAQAVTFLWRAMGQPEPSTQTNPFSDISTSSYYYKAVLWAYENGITTGKNPGSGALLFAPNDTCTRAQIVTFLWRAEGQPGHTAGNPFTDVANGGTFTDAILWAYENGITTGRTQGDGSVIFMPNDYCTRAQIVTFLYRDMAE